MAKEQIRNGCSSCLKQFQNPFVWPWKNFECCKHLNCTGKIYAAEMATLIKNFERMMPAIRTSDKKLRMDDARCSNG